MAIVGVIHGRNSRGGDFPGGNNVEGSDLGEWGMLDDDGHGE